eukprot:CAMPEP_0175042188 /NCGR_PEP_ID=MMETSP0052_2-20121109/2399_1 /TAXON_ID=51329 ORGANISM="Polytomella parva, Strain SAG 63-3" /NCGR_SAMPLE_ID=MMETSP0052_2 /ASSEMBLY_ACC=CAM_ASM_000194 /LENGTH=312 /DNA_ID=CAMNT_0016304921 /DNA_START=37 /DNA_END=975 /DNA_ORIENTATION=+
MADDTQMLEKKLQDLGLGRDPQEFVNSLEEPIKSRVELLKTIQKKHDDFEGQYRIEKAELEAKYQKLYAPLYSERSEIVTSQKDEGSDVVGIPEFWQVVLLKCDVTCDMIKDHDIDVLKYLKDIKSETITNEEGKDNGFKLFFSFNENPYFTNEVLEKTYILLADDDGILEKADGTTIDWKAGKDVTVKTTKKKNKKGGKIQTKVEKVESFFNFFAPHKLPDESQEDIDEEAMEELHSLVEADYEVGSTIRDRLIPHAVYWYTGEAIEDDFILGDDESEAEGEEEEEEEESEQGEEENKEAAGDAKPECKQQ